MVPSSHISYVVRLNSDPLDLANKPVSGVNRLVQGVQVLYLRQILKRGWVQFTWTKRTNGSESSVIATLNKDLYTYTFKGGDVVNKRGLIRFVCLSRSTAKGRPAWRSAYAMDVLSIIDNNKNQGKGRSTKNTKVNVDTGTRTTIEWDYKTGKPL